MIRTGVALLFISILFGVTASAQTVTQTIINLPGGQIGLGGVTLEDLDGDGVPEIIAGGTDGIVHAVSGKTNTVLWSTQTGGGPIQTTPAVGDLQGNGHMSVVVGTGFFSPNMTGGIFVLDATGHVSCSYLLPNFSTDVAGRVLSTPALGDLDGSGKLKIVFTGLDGYIYVLNGDCTVSAKSTFFRETQSGTAALADLNHSGKRSIIVGTVVRKEAGFFNLNGGYLYATDGQLNNLPGWPIPFDEGIEAPPSVADVDGDGNMEVASGTGFCWANPACAPFPDQSTPSRGKYLSLFNSLGQYKSGWPLLTTNELSRVSSAFAQFESSSKQLDTVFSTTFQVQNGMNYGLQGSRLHVVRPNGTEVPGWPATPIVPQGATTSGNPSITGPIIADVFTCVPAGPQIIAGTTSSFELVVFCPNGTQISRTACCNTPPLALVTEYLVEGPPAVGDVNGDGMLEIVAGSARTGGSTGAIYIWTTGKPKTVYQPWPLYRRDPHNDGTLPADVIFKNGFESP